MNSVFFYTATLSFVLGAFVRSLYHLTIWHISLFGIIAIALFALWTQRKLSRGSVMLVVSTALLLFMLGVLRLDMTSWQESRFVEQVDREVTFEGIVIREPEQRATSVHLYVKTDGETLLVNSDRYTNIAYGDRVRVEGTLTKPESFETDLGRTFNYPGYLRARDVEYRVSFADIDVVSHGEGNVLFSFLFTLKERFTDTLEQIIPEPQVGLGEGLLLGIKRALGEDLETTFRQTGIIHIVVLSGYNVMIVVEALMRLLSALFMPRTRMVLGVSAIIAFAILVGLSATVVRASIMAALVLIARTTGRIYAITRALVIAGIIMLLVNPYLLVFDPGFQLSFLATLGLIFVAPHIERILGFVPTKWQVREFVTATIATQIMVLPLLLYLIGEFSIVAVLVNVLVLPAVPFAMLFTFLTGIVGFFSGTLALLAGFGAHVLLSYIIGVANAFGSLPFAAVGVPSFPFVVVILLYAAILYVLVRYRNVATTVVTDTVFVDDSIDVSDWTIVDVRAGRPGEARSASPGPFPFK